MSLEFPQIDPVALAIGPVQIRWYAIAYITGILLGWFYIKKILGRYGEEARPNKSDIDDFMNWAIVGIILGGRLGYIIFYNLSYYLSNPLKVFHVWEGGMSFHGGFLGVAVAIIMFSKKNKVNMFRLADLLACASPIGLFFGRIANFINAELYGRVTGAPWGIVFPNGGEQPRHPSQLYEAFLEGAVLFLILGVCSRFDAVRQRSGLLAVVFIGGYAVSRFIIEFFREPDAHLGYFASGATMGQILSMGMIAGALLLMVIILRVHKKKNVKT